MAIVEIAHNPELTVSKARQIFREHFSRGYIVDTPGFFQRLFPRRQFAVRRDDWTGIGIRLKQNDGSTSFVFTALPPPSGIKAFMYNLAPPLAWLILRPGRKELENEVKVFIENAADFR